MEVIMCSVFYQGLAGYNLLISYKTNLMIPKGKSEAVNQWKTDNAMAKRYQRGNQKP
jgi:hypothetical protein